MLRMVANVLTFALVYAVITNAHAVAQVIAEVSSR